MSVNLPQPPVRDRNSNGNFDTGQITKFFFGDYSISENKTIMRFSISNRLRKSLSPPHPTWQSRRSRNRVFQFLQSEQDRSHDGLQLNIGSGSRRFGKRTLNLDLLEARDVDIRGDLLHLPIKDESIDSVICTGVLEHVEDACQGVREIYRVLKCGGRVFFETPFMQTVHASPRDFCR